MSNRHQAAMLAHLLLLLILAGCTSIRPLVKIGLIAPFEGLYRESGYAALEAMRQAIEDCAAPGMDVLPLALDDSGDPAQAQRAAQKLLVDPSVRAIVGPLLIDAIPSVGEVLSTKAQVSWHIPPLAAIDGDVTPARLALWLATQIDYIAANSNASRVLLLGLPEAWELETSSLPIIQANTLDDALVILQEGDAVLWLGRPDAGARWLATFSAQESSVQFWFADQAGIDVLFAHTQDRKDFHWFIWTNSDYNPWSKLEENAQPPNEPRADTQPSDTVRQATYRATCVALRELETQAPAPTSHWELSSQHLGLSISE